MIIGVIAGNFDCIHPGYIRMFDEMQEHCESVWVLLQTDPTIERPEKCKPVLSVDERISILSSLKQISHIIPYTTENDLYELLKSFSGYNVNPDQNAEFIRFLGDDYVGRSFTGDDLDIKIHYLNRDHGWSTTKYKQLIAESINKK
jgi:glycerol-3-phosphate cytidylyltransferase